MPNHYARATALSNVGGRLDYISNSDRQEHLLAFCDGAADQLDGQFWRQLARESQDAFDQFGQKTRMVKNRKTGEMEERKLKCCQAREIMQPLSNALLQRMDPETIAQTIVDEFREKLGLTVAVAVHQNKKENNLHAHIIFPERQLLQEPTGQKIAERNLFFDETGKRRYKKAEILDENKELRPGCKIIKKGEVYGDVKCFSSADPKYSRKAWLESTKNDVLLPLINGKLKGDVEFTKYDANTGKLPQQHVGKEATPEVASRIEAYNREVREYNNLVDAARLPAAITQDIQQKIVRSSQRNQLLQALTDRLKGILRTMQEQQKKKKQEEALKAKAEYEKRYGDRKVSLNDQINMAGGRMNWRLQGQIDKVQGTDHAKQNKNRHFKKKGDPDGR